MRPAGAEFCSESDWLIYYGWRPAPTTASESGAWEHVAWSRVPKSCLASAKEMGTYDCRWWRHPTAQACAITMAMLAMSECCDVIPREMCE